MFLVFSLVPRSVAPMDVFLRHLIMAFSSFDQVHRRVLAAREKEKVRAALKLQQEEEEEEAKERARQARHETLAAVLERSRKKQAKVRMSDMLLHFISSCCIMPGLLGELISVCLKTQRKRALRLGSGGAPQRREGEERSRREGQAGG